MTSQQEGRPPRILAVDDDDLVLHSLRGLISLETDYSLIEFAHPQRAIDEIRQNPVDLVISDFMMPGVNGIDLLKEARQLQPDASRILLTGYADKASAIRAINEADLYQYLEKPWENEGLLTVIRNALQEKNLRRQLQGKVKELDRLLKQHTDLTDRYRSIERELEMAARVQRSLLPEKFPPLDGFEIDALYEPCQAMGGDYYDFCLRDGWATLLISDVSGHGVPAALTSMLLKAIFQDMAAVCDEPAGLLSQMSNKLYRFLPAGVFVAGMIIRVDSARDRIQVANAGLPYPFVVSPGSERGLAELPLSGLPLALFAESGPEQYGVREFTLAPGEILLAGSDGLREARNSGGEFFQNRQLHETLKELSGRKPNSLIGGLIEKAREFSAADGFADDVSLLTITRL